MQGSKTCSERSQNVTRTQADNDSQAKSPRFENGRWAGQKLDTQVNSKTWLQNAVKREGRVIRSVFKTYSERNSRTWPKKTISNCTGGVDVWSTKVVIRLRGVTIHYPWNWIWGSEAPRTQNQNAANVRGMLLKTHLDASKKQQQNVTQNVNAWISFWNAERQNGNAKRQNVVLGPLSIYRYAYVCIYIYMYMYVYLYEYIYIYIHIISLFISLSVYMREII